MPLGELLALQAHQYPKETALIFSDQSIGYQELHQQSLSLARGLKQIGVHPGERVALLLHNSPEYLCACFALFQLGAIAVPINTYLVAEEINYILENSGTCAIITTKEFYQLITKEQELPITLRNVIFTTEDGKDVLSLEEVKQRGEGSADPTFADSRAPAVLIYTSGTTGRPKGVILTHENLASNIKAGAQRFKLKRSDRFLVFLPMFHSFTLTVSILLPIYVGAKIILLPGIRREKIKEAIVKHRPTVLLGVPTVYNMLSNASMSLLARWLNPIKLYICGGAPLPLEVRQRFEKTYGRRLLEGYGLSEASPVVSINPPKKAKACSVGLPLPGIDVKVVDEQGKELGPEQVGELIVQGPNVMQGYWQNSEATNEVIKEGWLYTGDMARLDKDGYIYLVDRKKELIIVRGMNVYPREIEDVLHQHPAVSEVAVIGIPDHSRGEVPKAFIVIKQESQNIEKELRELAKKHLAPYKVPHHIEFRPELPKTGSGKIAKQQLRIEHKA